MFYVEVYDNFFTEELHMEIFNKLMEPKWELTGGSLNNKFWHIEDLHDEEYFNTYIFDIIKKKIGKDYTYERIYANGQTAGQCGTPHKDEGDLTFLYYPSPIWDVTWEGHLIFLDEDCKYDKMIPHAANRAVLFDANVTHYANAPSRFFNDLRISLAYKLWKK